ncbi:MAG: hypothetical protein IKN59_08860 [Paludibacteraceae bacterium]|jgi:hypothetical protein|nr:hypothetical protein [Paludibacteraceae bacterium]
MEKKQAPHAALSKTAAKVQLFFHSCKFFYNFFSKKFQKGKLHHAPETALSLIINTLSFENGKLAHKIKFLPSFFTFHTQNE